MAVLPLEDKTLYIVLYELRTLGKHSFAAQSKTYENWLDADKAAKDAAIGLKVRAWVAAIERPNLIELVK